MYTLANSEDPDEMLHSAAFHQGLHCLLRQDWSSEKEIQYFLKIKTCDPSIYTIDYPDLTANFIRKSIGIKRVNWKWANTCLFVWFDSLCPINNLSVKQGPVFLGWTSTKLG